MNVVHDVNRASAKRYYDRFSLDEWSRAACNASSRMKTRENNLKQCKIYGSFTLRFLVSSDYGLRLQNFRLLKDGNCKSLQGNGSNGIELSHDKLRVVI